MRRLPRLCRRRSLCIRVVAAVAIVAVLCFGVLLATPDRLSFLAVVQQSQGPSSFYNGRDDLGSQHSKVRLDLPSEEEVTNSIAVLIKTHERPKCARQAVASFRQHYPTIPVILADDSETVDDDTQQLVTDYPSLQLLRLPTDSGTGYGRNALIAAAHERGFDLVVMADDDHVIMTPQLLQRMLLHMRVTGAQLVAPTIVDNKNTPRSSGRIEIDEAGHLIILPGANYMTAGVASSCTRTDLFQQFFLAQTTTLLQSGWDNVLKNNDHYDFLLNLKTHGFLAVQCSDLFVRHAKESCQPNAASSRYMTVRTRRWYQLAPYFMSKWSLNTIHDEVGKVFRLTTNASAIVTSVSSAASVASKDPVFQSLAQRSIDFYNNRLSAFQLVSWVPDSGDRISVIDMVCCRVVLARLSTAPSVQLRERRDLSLPLDTSVRKIYWFDYHHVHCPVASRLISFSGTISLSTSDVEQLPATKSHRRRLFIIVPTIDANVASIVPFLTLLSDNVDHSGWTVELVVANARPADGKDLLSKQLQRALEPANKLGFAVRVVNANADTSSSAAKAYAVSASIDWLLSQGQPLDACQTFVLVAATDAIAQLPKAFLSHLYVGSDCRRGIFAPIAGFCGEPAGCTVKTWLDSRYPFIGGTLQLFAAVQGSSRLLSPAVATLAELHGFDTALTAALLQSGAGVRAYRPRLDGLLWQLDPEDGTPLGADFVTHDGAGQRAMSGTKVPVTPISHTVDVAEEGLLLSALMQTGTSSTWDAFALIAQRERRVRSWTKTWDVQNMCFYHRVWLDDTVYLFKAIFG